jgi:hypothetical protein
MKLIDAIKEAKLLAITHGSATIGCAYRDYIATSGHSHCGRLVAQVWYDGRIDLKNVTNTEATSFFVQLFPV